MPERNNANLPTLIKIFKAKRAPLDLPSSDTTWPII